MAQPRSPFALPEKYRAKLNAATGIVRVRGDVSPDAVNGYCDDLAARNPWLLDALADVIGTRLTAPRQAPRTRRPAVTVRRAKPSRASGTRRPGLDRVRPCRRLPGQQGRLAPLVGHDAARMALRPLSPRHGVLAALRAAGAQTGDAAARHSALAAASGARRWSSCPARPPAPRPPRRHPNALRRFSLGVTDVTGNSVNLSHLRGYRQYREWSCHIRQLPQRFVVKILLPLANALDLS